MEAHKSATSCAESMLSSPRARPHQGAGLSSPRQPSRSHGLRNTPKARKAPSQRHAGFREIRAFRRHSQPPCTSSHPSWRPCQAACTHCHQPCTHCQQPCTRCQQPCTRCQLGCRHCQPPCTRCETPCTRCQTPPRSRQTTQNQSFTSSRLNSFVIRHSSFVIRHSSFVIPQACLPHPPLLG